MRLQKFLADCGVCSRRAAEALIEQGKVLVDGKVVTQMGVKIDTDKNVVTYEGRILEIKQNNIYIALHKPIGFITTSKDQFGRPCVLDLLDNVSARVFPVGRLDYDTSGLLLLTNDGDFAYKMTHPKHNIYKKYIALVKGVLTDNDVNALKNGVMLDGVKTMPAKVAILGTNNKNQTSVQIEIAEGKNRQVRRMFDKVSHSVVKLHREAIGGLSLGNLKSGHYRYLDYNEVRGLL